MPGNPTLRWQATGSRVFFGTEVMEDVIAIICDADRAEGSDLRMKFEIDPARDREFQDSVLVCQRGQGAANAS